MKKTNERKKEDCELLERYHIKTLSRKRNESPALVLDWFKKEEGLIVENSTGWYVDKLECNKKWIGFIDRKAKTCYGIGMGGTWFNSKSKPTHINNNERLATPEETLKRLSEFAIDKGYKEKQSECLTGTVNDKIDFQEAVFFIEDETELWIEGGDNNQANLIMRDGVWAEFIEEEVDHMKQFEDFNAALNEFYKSIEKFKELLKATVKK